MQAFRRLYSSIPDAAAAARTASTPRAVRLRRLRKRPEVPAGASDATPSGLTPSEQARFQRSYAKGELTDGAGNYLSEGQWLNKLDARRQRIRGIRVAKSEAGEKELQVVGQKVYLPNVIFTLVRNHTPPGQPYNPYEATFRVAQSITKTDIRSYLSAAYGVKSTYIRTDNYSAKTSVLGQTKSVAYKRAVVGLVDPFYFPKAVEDMNAKDRKEREDWLEENFRMQQDKDDRKSVQLLISRRRSDGWRWRTGVTANRRNIIHLIAARRAERESLLADMKVQVRGARQSAVSQPA
ncbi:hypothetical protein PHLGIDRAFT_111598 [Phlebiopsis gigantea 11061_1 CR5-6]|uniref:Large ribosomal subunit protein uL23m n=1 Tax=Phlebiopsis gigantea (strain 11061_1 CR5-6) TaxID=745531 RepID=A0A0C3S494_PHLG1|nr:hypothetical protein PHLGIDRAFT_111598 [Phlebiopsis gigantea 11061_1 CR5-6]